MGLGPGVGGRQERVAAGLGEGSAAQGSWWWQRCGERCLQGGYGESWVGHRPPTYPPSTAPARGTPLCYETKALGRAWGAMDTPKFPTGPTPSSATTSPMELSPPQAQPPSGRGRHSPQPQASSRQPALTTCTNLGGEGEHAPHSSPGVVHCSKEPPTSRTSGQATRGSVPLPALGSHSLPRLGSTCPCPCPSLSITVGASIHLPTPFHPPQTYQPDAALHAVQLHSQLHACM